MIWYVMITPQPMLNEVTYPERNNVIERGHINRSFTTFKPVYWLSLSPLLFIAGGIAWPHHLACCICDAYLCLMICGLRAWHRHGYWLLQLGWMWMSENISLASRTHTCWIILRSNSYPIWHVFLVVMVLLVFRYNSNTSQAPHTSRYTLVFMV